MNMQITAELNQVNILDYDFFALGWHREFVLGAMAAGCSADKAVELAIWYCEKAGGKVQTVHRSWCSIQT